ncbi:MAG: CDGSH iron-sulfur domain-containing protein [Gemmatimonadetes bacterium]|nr:CDGSH iron-sulfur domain-containing protein [Gemmatimonadota bacterium]
MSASENSDVAGEEACTISVTEDGPIKVEGDWRLLTRGDSAAVVAGDRPRGTVWLCRCGHSAKKPFCDGTHKKEGFSAEGI